MRTSNIALITKFLNPNSWTLPLLEGTTLRKRERRKANVFISRTVALHSTKYFKLHVFHVMYSTLRWGRKCWTLNLVYLLWGCSTTITIFHWSYISYLRRNLNRTMLLYFRDDFRSHFRIQCNVSETKKSQYSVTKSCSQEVDQLVNRLDFRRSLVSGPRPSPRRRVERSLLKIRVKLFFVRSML